MEKEVFKDAKVGDRVWDMRYGWGTIRAIIKGNEYPLQITFDKVEDYCKIDMGSYSCKGICIYNENNKISTLFWNEFEIPKEAYIKPLPKLDVDTKVLVWNLGKRKMKRHFSHFNKEGTIYCFDEGRTSFTQEGGDERVCSTSPWDNYEIYQEGDK